MEGVTGNGLLSGDALITARRRRVDTSLGSAVLVRALGYAGIAELASGLIDVASLADVTKDTQPADLVKGSAGKSILTAIEKIIVAGCVEPRFGTDPVAGPVVADLPLEDQLVIFTAILELSGYSRAAGESIRPS